MKEDDAEDDEEARTTFKGAFKGAMLIYMDCSNYSSKERLVVKMNLTERNREMAAAPNSRKRKKKKKEGKQKEKKFPNPELGVLFF